MANRFEIQIQDGSKVISDFCIDENTKAIQLYDWQRRAIKYFFQNSKSIFEVTTGAGKTFCTIQILKEIWKAEPDLKALVVVPKNVILEDTWFREFYEHGISLVDVGVYYGRMKEIGKKVTITNMQSIHIVPDIFDIVVFDEIHNYGTARMLPFVEKEYKYKLGLSATMERMDNKHYDIMRIFDYNVFKYTPHEALHDGVLNPFKFYNIGVQLDDDARDRYEILTEDINTILISGGGFKRIMRTGSGLKNTMLKKMTQRKQLVNNYYRKYDVVKLICDKHIRDKIIIFNEFNDITNKTYWYLLDIGVKACVVHSDLPKEEREKNLTGFRRDKYNCVLASRVLDEGFNLPKIDTAIIAAGNSTSRQTVQRMGRVLRRKAKHSNLYQIYCRDTVEEGYAYERAKMFKVLCSDYKDYNYTEELVL